MILYRLAVCVLILAGIVSCSSDSPQNQSTDFATFKEDVDFLKKHTEIIVLEEAGGKAKIAVSPALQARVMTSTAGGDSSRSYGWINRALFESGDTLAHINPYGGEERFWLGPEGGQYSLFFPAGSAFTLDNWQTPRLIDLDPFTLESNTGNQAIFTKNASLTNYAGFTFHLFIERTIQVIPPSVIYKILRIEPSPGVQVTGFSTSNMIVNKGDVAWSKETGLISIWLLGMFNPSAATVVVMPYNEGDEGSLGPVVNDNYFGKVPADRLKIGKSAVFFKGDGKFRSKIGLSALRAKKIIGSYDSKNHVLTIVQYNKPEQPAPYVNSLWEIQKDPYNGDVVNAYNDGPATPGGKPLGPFYELETSSPALELKPKGAALHTQFTYHFEGNEAELSKIAQKLLGVTIEEIKGVF